MSNGSLFVESGQFPSAPPERNHNRFFAEAGERQGVNPSKLFDATNNLEQRWGIEDRH
jgi:hypothetical protein